MDGLFSHNSTACLMLYKSKAQKQKPVLSLDILSLSSPSTGLKLESRSVRSPRAEPQSRTHPGRKRGIGEKRLALPAQSYGKKLHIRSGKVVII